MTSDKGLSYAAGIWRKSSPCHLSCSLLFGRTRRRADADQGRADHPVLILDSTLDLACVETQIHTGVRESDERDCELIEYEGEGVFGRVAVPL